MAIGKSPGINGLTLEVHCHCWHLIEDLCFEMIMHLLLGDREILPTIQQRVLKIIPRRRSKTSLGLASNCNANKIIDKLLALHLCIILPALVSKCQMGFIPERQILGHISIT